MLCDLSYVDILGLGTLVPYIANSLSSTEFAHCLHIYSHHFHLHKHILSDRREGAPEGEKQLAWATGEGESGESGNDRGKKHEEEGIHVQIPADILVQYFRQPVIIGRGITLSHRANICRGSRLIKCK